MVYEPRYFIPEAELREEAREGWDHFVSDEIVYIVGQRDAKSAPPKRWVSEYIKGALWFEVVLYRIREYPLAIWVIEACPELRNHSNAENMGLPSVVWLKRFGNIPGRAGKEGHTPDDGKVTHYGPPCQIAISDDGEIWLGRIMDIKDRFFDVHVRPEGHSLGAVKWMDGWKFAAIRFPDLAEWWHTDTDGLI